MVEEFWMFVKFMGWLERFGLNLVQLQKLMIIFEGLDGDLWGEYQDRFFQEHLQRMLPLELLVQEFQHSIQSLSLLLGMNCLIGKKGELDILG